MKQSLARSRPLVSVPKKGSEKDNGTATGVVERVLNILEAFTPAEPQLTITVLSRKLGLNKSTVHRLAGMLAERGFLQRDPETRAYSLGPALLRLTHAALGQRDLVAISYPLMRRLRDQTGETVTLNVLAGRSRICIAQVESLQELRMRLDIGKPVPLYCGAASKVLLAHRAPEEVEAVIRETGLKPLGPGSITDPNHLRRQLEEIRRNGYATSHQERTAGGITLAAPLRDAAGSVTASLGLYAPASRVDHKRLLTWVPLIIETARGISRELGFVQ